MYRDASYESGPRLVERPDTKPELTPYVPFYHETMLYTNRLKNFLYPYEFSGWADEQQSWERTCYLHGGLNPSPTHRFSGPEAADFLAKYCVNTFINFPVNSGKHCVTCNEDGTISSDGVILRTGENEYVTYWMFSLAILAKKYGSFYDMKFEDITDDMFLFQIGGPRSLEILEKVTDDDFRDIKFFRFKTSKIAGHSLRVVRVGMAGSLAYEIHGRIEDAKEIYDAIYKAGVPYGIRRLGWHTYMMQHTLNGFPQFGYHFNIKLPETPFQKNVHGSCGEENDGTSDPIELGWKKCIKLDHDFVGRKVLEEKMEHQTRDMVSLEWNVEDVIKIFASRFEDGEQYDYFEDINDISGLRYPGIHRDKVLNERGEVVGWSAGRMYSVYYRRMVSLAAINIEETEIGNELYVLWGEPGHRQLKVRARVERFPYFNEFRNQKVDVASIKR